MKYNVLITEFQNIEIEAESEDAAIELVKKQVLAQNPRSIATYSVAQEISIIEEIKGEEIKQEELA